MSLYTRLSTALAAGQARDANGLFSDERAIEPIGGVHVPAAVLIAITDRAEPGVILTERPHTMRAHAGQVAFPGGKIDAGDADPVAAALREAEEELALPADRARIIGTTDEYRTGSGFAITPVLALVPPDLAYRPNPDEVADWFEAPLGFVLDPANRVRKSAMWLGKERHYLEICWQGRRIWGVTAGIIHNLAQRLGPGSW